MRVAGLQLLRPGMPHNEDMTLLGHVVNPDQWRWCSRLLVWAGICGFAGHAASPVNPPVPAKRDAGMHSPLLIWPLLWSSILPSAVPAVGDAQKKLPGRTSCANRAIVTSLSASSLPPVHPAQCGCGHAPCTRPYSFCHHSPSRVWMPPSWWICAIPSALHPCAPRPCVCRCRCASCAASSDGLPARRRPVLSISALVRTPATPSWAVPQRGASCPPSSSVVDSVRQLLSLSLSPVPGPRPGGKVRVVAGTQRSRLPCVAPRSSIPAAASTHQRS